MIFRTTRLLNWLRMWINFKTYFLSTFIKASKYIHIISEITVQALFEWVHVLSEYKQKINLIFLQSSMLQTKPPPPQLLLHLLPVYNVICKQHAPLNLLPDVICQHVHRRSVTPTAHLTTVSLALCLYHHHSHILLCLSWLCVSSATDHKTCKFFWI